MSINIIVSNFISTINLPIILTKCGAIAILASVNAVNSIIISLSGQSFNDSNFALK